MVSTTPTLEGFDITEYHGIVTGHVILGANVIRDLFASIRDFIGGRSRSYEQVLRAAERQALEEMVEQARQAGANACVGVDLDYETITRKGSMIVVIATGTAVSVRKTDRSMS